MSAFEPGPPTCRRGAQQETHGRAVGVKWVAARIALTALALMAATSMQGCLPPDWSFCDCDFRDNFWNHVLTDIGLLWDGPDFLEKARDNRTFQGRYLQGPLPDGYECPMAANVFWKAWPQYGMSRGLIEGSMGDLWMPGARDRIKQICMAGHLALCTICAHHFLVRAAKGIEAGEADHMKYLEAAYSHMVSIRNLAHAYQLRNCMGQQGWSMKVAELHAWSEKWLGREAEGTFPMAAYYGGKLDPYQMLFTEPQAHTQKSRTESLPDRRPCTPYKDPTCWKRKSLLLLETCEYCCSPFEHKTGRGADWCFQGSWTYERCCQTDFKDLVCEQKRKGEEGGCVDCKKTVTYVCLTPPEKRLQDAQDNYNKKVDHFNNLRSQVAQLAIDIGAARDDLFAKDAVYQEHAQEHQYRLQVWSGAFNNNSRLLSEGRLAQQILSWNLTDVELKAAQDSHRAAQEVRSAAQLDLRQAEEAERLAQESVVLNRSTHERAVKALANARNDLQLAKESQALAEDRLVQADAELKAAIEAREQALETAGTQNRTREEVYEATATEFLEADTVHNASTAAFETAKEAEEQARQLAMTAREAHANESAKVVEAKSHTADAERSLESAHRVVEGATQARDDAAELLRRRNEQLEAARQNQAVVREALLQHEAAQGPEAVEALRCLMELTAGNSSARPGSFHGPRRTRARQPVAAAPIPEVRERVCTTPEAPKAEEDTNTFCGDWAAGGECERNPGYMLKACGTSCAKLGFAKPAPEPVCTEVVVQAAQVPDVPEVVEEESPETEEPQGDALAAALGPASAALVQALELALAAGAETPVPLAAAAEGTQSEESGTSPLDALRARDAAAETLVALRVTLASVQVNLTQAEAENSTAMLEHQEAAAQEAARRNETDEARQRFSTAEQELVLAQAALASNETAVEKAQEIHDAAIVELKTAEAAAAASVGHHQGLLQNKSEALAQEKESASAVIKLHRKVLVLEDHINSLNGTISENLTSLVTAWLLEQEQQQVETWGDWTLQFVKRTVVNLVGSLESFLENYVMSLTDKESIKELTGAVRDKKAAEEELKKLTAGETDLAARVQEISRLVQEAEAIRTELAGKAELLRQEEERAHTASSAAALELQAARGGLVAATQRLEEANQTKVLAEERLLVAEQSLAAAAAAAAEKLEALRSQQALFQEALLHVTQADSSLMAAEAALAAAQQASVESLLVHLQLECKATDAVFQDYLRHRDLVSVAQAAVVLLSRLRAAASERLAAAEQHLAEAQGNVTRATSTLEETTRLQVAQEGRLQEAAAELERKEAALTEASEALKAAKEVKKRDLERLEAVQGQRNQADLTAASAVAAYAQRCEEADRADALQVQRTGELEFAVNMTERCTGEVARSEVAEADAKVSLEAAEAWIGGYVETLLIPEKKQTLEDALEVERQHREIEVTCAKRELMMRRLRQTHERHLALLNAQVELQEKEAERVRTKELFTRSEQAVIDAQEKLDTLVKTEQETQENIAKTYQEIQELLEEHKLAQEEYNKQDPEDRKRSFSTSLSGSGADPG